MCIRDRYYRLAEEEFAVAVDEYNRDHWLDIAAYKAPTEMCIRDRFLAFTPSRMSIRGCPSSVAAMDIRFCRSGVSVLPISRCV